MYLGVYDMTISLSLVWYNQSAFSINGNPNEPATVDSDHHSQLILALATQLRDCMNVVN